MQEIAAEFMRDTSELPTSPEAGVAHRLMGVTKWFVGEFDEARSHLEQALAIYDAGRDSDLAFQFGQDAGVAAMEFLALTLWPLGQVELASKVIVDMAARIRLTDYAATTYYGLLFLGLYETLCGDSTGLNLRPGSHLNMPRNIKCGLGVASHRPSWVGRNGKPADGLKASCKSVMA